MINTIQIALSGMQAATKRVEAGAANIANLSTSGALPPMDGPAPYQPVTVTQTAISAGGGDAGGGVAANITLSNRPFTPSYAPDSPFSDANGMVASPTINLAEEIVSMNLAKHSYNANLQTIKTAAEMEASLLAMFDDKA